MSTVAIESCSCLRQLASPGSSDLLDYLGTLKIAIVFLHVLDATGVINNAERAAVAML